MSQIVPLPSIHGISMYWAHIDFNAGRGTQTCGVCHSHEQNWTWENKRTSKGYCEENYDCQNPHTGRERNSLNSSRG